MKYFFQILLVKRVQVARWFHLKNYVLNRDFDSKSRIVQFFSQLFHLSKKPPNNFCVEKNNNLLLNIYSTNLHIVLQFTDAALKTNTWTHIKKDISK